MPLSLTSVATTALTLAAVLGLVILAGRALRRVGVAGFRPNTRLAIRESLAIDRNRSLRIISCDQRELLLLIGGSSDVVIGWLPSSDRNA